MPLTLLRLEKAHQAAVLEVGTNHPGELAPLVKMIQPRYGVITSVGREHLEFFGDLAGVAEEEGWLAELLPADGKLFVNGDNEWTDRIARRTRATVVRVGLADGNDWRARSLRLDKQGVTFRVDVAEGGVWRRVSDQSARPTPGGERAVCDGAGCGTGSGPRGNAARPGRLRAGEDAVAALGIQRRARAG